MARVEELHGAAQHGGALGRSGRGPLALGALGGGVGLVHVGAVRQHVGGQDLLVVGVDVLRGLAACAVAPGSGDEEPVEAVVGAGGCGGRGVR